MKFEPEKKYRILRGISWVCRLIGTVIVVVPTVFCVVGYFAGFVAANQIGVRQLGLGDLMLSPFVLLSVFVCLFIIAVPFFAFGELIMVFLDIEEHARVTRYESKRASELLAAMRRA